MLELLVLIGRALALACRGHHELVLENLALRQQLHALRRTGIRPQLRRRDRLLWIVLAQTWRHWRAALVLVQPDTVVRWHASSSAGDGPDGRDRSAAAAPSLIIRTRTHLGLQKDTPDHRPVSGTPTGPIVAIPEVGGLHHRYERRAA